MENHIKMDDLGVPPFLETPILKLTILGTFDQHFTQFSVTIAGHLNEVQLCKPSTFRIYTDFKCVP